MDEWMVGWMDGWAPPSWFVDSKTSCEMTHESAPMIPILLLVLFLILILILTLCLFLLLCLMPIPILIP